MTRRLLPFLLLPFLPLLAGCSSPHKLELANECADPISVTVLWNDEDAGETTKRSASTSVAPGRSETEGVWFGRAPSRFTIRVTAGSRRWEREFREAEYPASLHRVSSAGPTTSVIVREGEIAFSE